MKTLITATIILFVCTANLGAVYYEEGGNDWSEPQYADGVLIVKFESSVQTSDLKVQSGNISTGMFEVDNAFIEHSVDKLESLFPGATRPEKGRNMADLTRFYRIEFPSQIDLLEIKEELQNTPGIESVEKVGIHQIAATPNDNLYSNQWHHLDPQDNDIDTPDAWEVETGDSSVIVAIVDTGVLWDHGDLGGSAPYTNGNIWVNWDEINGASGVDDDGNGYVDDFRGWDWVSVTGAWSGEDASTPDNDPTDFNGHGTHCAGITAAMTNNGTGISGVAGGFYPTQRGVKIMSLRAGWSAPHPQYGYETGYVRMDFCAQAFYYAVDNGADVISCSWGSSNSGGMAAALSYAVGNEVVVVKAAGNSDDTYADYLCSQPEVVSVASTNQSDFKSGFSSYGAWVDISAPGSSIYSTYSDQGSPTYASLSGTSMATPMVAGVCALIKSRNTNLGKSEIEAILFNTAEDIDPINPSYAGLLGAGRINAQGAVTQLLFSTFDASPRMGEPPLTVEFEGYSPFDVNSWKYYFGDGDSSDLQNPQHTYTEPGAYTITQEISAASGDASTTVDSFVYVLADTLESIDFEGDFSTTDIEVPVRVKNVIPIDEMIIPITYDGALDIAYDSFSVAGTRTEYFEKAQIVALNFAEKAIVFRLLANDGGGSPPMGAGDGDILKLYFHVGTPSSETTIIDTTTFNNYMLDFSTFLGDYIPGYASAEISLSSDIRGDANGDQTVNVSDAVHIINYIFLNGEPPVSQCGGDANNDSDVNVSDAVFIINYIFINGSPPDPCF
jgi:subtilisin family serine protease